MERFERLVPAGVPVPVAAWLGAAWLVLVLAWAGGIITSWTFTVFLMVLLGALVGTGVAAASVARGKEPFRAARALTVMAMALVVPVVFDPHTTDVFDLPKYTVLVVGSLVLAGLWITGTVSSGALPRWRNGLHWLLGAYLLWVLVSSLTSVNVHLSMLGAHGSYDGFYSALAFVTLTFSAAEAFDASDVPAVLGTLAFGAGSVAAWYGLVQLHDLVLHGHHWDFVHWIKGLPFHNVFSTLGNPNHLAGYISIVLPTCVLLGLRSRNRLVQLGVGVLVVALLAELLQSAARGAWVAVIASGVVLAIVMWPEIRRRPALPVAGVLAAAGAATVIFALGGAHYVGGKISSLFRSGPSSSVAQRFDMWTAALHIAAHHPLTGTGSDTFVYVFPRYESASWAKYLGFVYAADGAHDIFMNTLADRGFVGLALLVALVVAAGVISLRALMRLRRVERAGVAESAEATTRRVVLGAVAAGLVAYVVQAVFNIQQIALSMSWWLLLGLLAVVSAGALDLLVRSGVSGSSTPEPPGAPGAGGAKATRAAPGRTGWWDGRGWPTLLTGLACIVVGGLVAYGADGPWRAGHDYWQAEKIQAAYVHAEKSGASSSAVSHLGSEYFADLNHAMVLNPWAARYPAAAGVDLAVAASKSTTASTQQTDLSQADTYLVAAVRAEPEASQYRYELAQVLVGLSHLYPAKQRSYLSQALSETEAAVHWDPRDPGFRKYLATVRKDLKAAG